MMKQYLKTFLISFLVVFLLCSLSLGLAIKEDLSFPEKATANMFILLISAVVSVVFSATAAFLIAFYRFLSLVWLSAKRDFMIF